MLLLTIDGVRRSMLASHFSLVTNQFSLSVALDVND